MIGICTTVFTQEADTFHVDNSVCLSYHDGALPKRFPDGEPKLHLTRKMSPEGSAQVTALVTVTQARRSTEDPPR